jgi:hypothetical protein
MAETIRPDRGPSGMAKTIRHGQDHPAWPRPSGMVETVRHCGGCLAWPRSFGGPETVRFNKDRSALLRSSDMTEAVLPYGGRLAWPRSFGKPETVRFDKDHPELWRSSGMGEPSGFAEIVGRVGGNRAQWRSSCLVGMPVAPRVAPWQPAHERPPTRRALTPLSRGENQAERWGRSPGFPEREAVVSDGSTHSLIVCADHRHTDDPRPQRSDRGLSSP